MQKLLKWLDENIILVLAGFLLAFIPLYPKIPLFDILPGYIVRIRLEDFLVTFTLLLWFIWVLRRKISLGANPYLKFFLVYFVIGILSMLSAMFLLKTVPLQTHHVGKMVLHFVRRFEYFSLFFIFYTSIKSIRQVKIFLSLLILVMLAVTLYGYGQKYLYWPAYSTMNREFSKGWTLYLTANARVLSTFGGHYDLAAFTMMLLVILWSVFLGMKNFIGRILIFIVTGGAFWLLILTASRTSFLAYLGGIAVICFFWAFKKGLKKAILSWVIITTLSIVTMLSFGDLSERFTKLLKLDERLKNVKSLVFNPFGGPPPKDKAYYLANNPQGYGAVTSSSDQPPTPKRPVDVEKDTPLLVPIVPGSATVSAVARTFSQNALVYDLSTGIRLDALWPRAIKGFWQNPLLGTGYSTLTKEQVTDFSEAESTDNDFLRSLGETGILGFIAFYMILGSILITIWKSFTGVKDPLFYGLLVGLAGIIFGLLLNAIYIDIFEASKVAFSFWAIMGITLGGIKILKKDIEKNKIPARFPDYRSFKRELVIGGGRLLRSDLFALLIIGILAFYLRTYKINTPLADWHSWRQADTSSVTRHYVKEGINILYPTYHDLSSIPSGKPNPKGLRMVEFPLYNILSVLVDKVVIGRNIEFSQRLTTIFISLISLIFLYKLVKKYEDKKTAIVASLFFAIIPYNIFYSRVILPEPLLVCLSLGFLYYYDKWLERVKPRYFLLSALFGATAFLVKPYAFFVMPAIFYLTFKKWGFGALRKPFLYILGIAILIPFIWWRWWIGHFPEGMPAYTWLFNGDGIRFKGSFFYWLFADRLGRLILGYWGLPLFFGGLLAKNKKGSSLFHWLLVGTLLYLTVFATGNVRHDYYQILVIPVVSIFLAKGVMFFLSLMETTYSRITTVLLICICILGMEAFGWYFIKDLYNINHPEIVEAGSEVEKLSTYKSLVIAPYMGDTAFLYQTTRNGWPIVEGTIDDMIKKGAHYYVSVTLDDFANGLLKQTTAQDPINGRFKLLKHTDKYIIIQLVPDKMLPKS